MNVRLQGIDNTNTLDNGGKKLIDVKVDPATGGIIVSGAAAGSAVSEVDSAAFSVGTDSGTPAMGLYEATPTAVSDGDVGVLGMDANRNLRVTIEADNAGVGGGIQYDETDAADTDMTGTIAMMEIAGNLRAPLQGSVAEGLLVNLGANNDVTVASSALPAGAATAAHQGTQNLALSSMEFSLSLMTVELGAYARRELFDGTYNYYGYADPGTAETAASWRIEREDPSTGTRLYADGDSDFDNVWDDGSTGTADTLTYS